MTTQAPRRAVRTPLTVYRAERAAFTLALLATGAQVTVNGQPSLTHRTHRVER